MPNPHAQTKYGRPANHVIAEAFDEIDKLAATQAGFLKILLPDESRERSLALTRLEESVFWAKAAIARHEAVSHVNA